MSPIAAYLDELAGLLPRAPRRRILAEVDAHLLEAAAALCGRRRASRPRNARDRALRQAAEVARRSTRCGTGRARWLAACSRSRSRPRDRRPRHGHGVGARTERPGTQRARGASAPQRRDHRERNHEPPPEVVPPRGTRAPATRPARRPRHGDDAPAGAPPAPTDGPGAGHQPRAHRDLGGRAGDADRGAAREGRGGRGRRRGAGDGTQGAGGSRRPRRRCSPAREGPPRRRARDIRAPAPMALPRRRSHGRVARPGPGFAPSAPVRRTRLQRFRAWRFAPSSRWCSRSGSRSGSPRACRPRSSSRS